LTGRVEPVESGENGEMEGLMRWYVSESVENGSKIGNVQEAQKLKRNKP
jgi:hypothetical protein